MKLYPHATTDGIIQLVELAELEKLRAELAQTKKHLAEANKGARVNAHINQSLAGKVTSWQSMAERLATALTFWDVNHPALAAYEFATEGSPQMFTPCESCEAPLVCSDLGNCCAKSPQFANPDPLAEAVKRMEAVPCPPSAFTNTQWGFAKKQFISAAYESAKAGSLPDPIAEAVRRMEAVPVKELTNVGHTPNEPYGLDGKSNAIRTRLIQAAKGEQP